ncbi:hypothetical protein DXG01_004366 [Tephrocybe rancida]|nr:hypothetical protein DXG01_004366 [Tephrocybe rancida]
MSDALTASELASTADHLMAAKMFSLAACVMLFYDIAITMGNEIERIWMRPHTPMTVLWVLTVCNRYVLYPEALKIVTSFTIGAILGGVCLAAELAIKIWSFTDGTSLDLPEGDQLCILVVVDNKFNLFLGLVGCILTGRSSLRFAFTWIAELAFDSIIFFATCYRVWQHHRMQHGSASNILDRILRDGVVYFGVIFVANLVTVLIFMLAPPDIKAVNASFSTLITSLMVSRLILNLREGSAEGGMVLQSGAGGSEVEQHPRYEQELNSSTSQTLFGIRQELHAMEGGRFKR